MGLASVQRERPWACIALQCVHLVGMQGPFNQTPNPSDGTPLGVGPCPCEACEACTCEACEAYGMHALLAMQDPKAVRRTVRRSNGGFGMPAKGPIPPRPRWAVNVVALWVPSNSCCKPRVKQVGKQESSRVYATAQPRGAIGCLTNRDIYNPLYGSFSLHIFISWYPRHHFLCDIF